MSFSASSHWWSVHEVVTDDKSCSHARLSGKLDGSWVELVSSFIRVNHLLIHLFNKTSLSTYYVLPSVSWGCQIPR